MATDTRIGRSGFPGWLGRRIDMGVALAIIRFNDAEAKLLEADPENAESMRLATRKLEREAIGPFAAADVLDIRDSVSFAFEGANTLGILPDDNFSAESKMWAERLAALHAERRAQGRDPATLACCLFNHDVIDALPKILAGRRVSAISCRDLQPTLESEWGLVDVRAYQVPSQRAVRDVDGPYEASLHDEPMWPNGHTGCSRN